jgi:UDP-N-acetylmuramoyl-tripeptide--D-alanyl-D-alanine ligase
VTHLFSTDELTHATGGVMTVPFHADGVSIDTRTLAPGDLFVALRTETGDGHRHVAEAMQRGAAGALVHDQSALPDGARVLVVADTQAGLTALGAFGRRRFQGAVAAVTGSVGKTTTKDMLRTVLSASGPTHAAQASYNNHWGVPLTLARMPDEASYAVIEIGMNNPGEIAPLAALAAPDLAVITTVAAAHIGHLGSLEAIADEKASLLAGILQGGTAVLPEDDAQFARLLDRVPDGVALCTFGAAQLVDIDADPDGSHVHAVIDARHVRFRVNAPGRHMVMNALAALTAAVALGADLEVSAGALAGFSAGAGRGARRPILNGDAVLLDESYNASGASMRAALSVLALLPARRRVAVLGDMLELGAHSRAEHESLRDAVSDSADVLYACGPWMKFLYDAVPADKRGAYAADSEALALIVARDLRPGDAVLVKGSLGSRMRVVIAAIGALGETIGAAT